MTVTTILPKSDSPVSITQNVWNDGGQFVRIRSIQVRFSEFL